MREVQVLPVSPDRFGSVLAPARHERFLEALQADAELLGGRVLWHVNSTSQGGGVAEMLQSLLGYLAGGGITTRWVVVDGDDGFFDVTKRLHNLLHGKPGDGDGLGAAEREVYEATLSRQRAELLGMVATGDVVILHDPQTLGLAGALAAAGARVIWSCHVGVDEPNDLAREAWDFLRPYALRAHDLVFSRSAYAWEGLDADKVAVIPPCLDAFSPKNQPLDASTQSAILHAAELVPDGDGGDPVYRRQDSSPARVSRPADVIEDAPVPASAPMVVQVSRWDQLKDPVGVMQGFARHLPERLAAHLVLAGPAADSVNDDPEGEQVLAEVCSERTRLPQSVRRRVHIACLPMDDREENAATVNALQRRADVIVQKSLAEGFGLTVAEGMWKKRPVVDSRVGGIQDQIVHGQSGLLIDDPTDLAAFGHTVASVLNDPDCGARIGRTAHERVCQEYLAPVHLTRYLDLIGRVTG